MLPGVTLLEGVKVAVAPVGKPLAVSVMAFENEPFCGVTVMEYCAEPPGWMVCGAVAELIVKDGVTGAVTVTEFVPVALL